MLDNFFTDEKTGADRNVVLQKDIENTMNAARIQRGSFNENANKTGI